MQTISIICLVIAVMVLVTSIIMSYAINYSFNLPVEVTQDFWTSNTKIDTSINTFKISFSQDERTDLLNRLNNERTQIPTIPGTFSNYGMNSDEVTDIIAAWKTFDFDKFETNINQYTHYTTLIKGLNIHFLHINPGKKPVLLSHGWPGSFYEFYGVIPLLVKQGFSIVIPAIPGYGFSQAPTVPRFAYAECADIFAILMERLNYSKYYLQGGDWGSFITQALAQEHPDRVLGLHLNAFITLTLKAQVCTNAPSLCWYSDLARSNAEKQQLMIMLQESGYLHLQMTKPDTIGVALTNDPAGLAAYILEKFGTWTNQENLDKVNTLSAWNMDDLLTNVQIYWMTRSIKSSMRFYKEWFRSEAALNSVLSQVHVPVGLAAFPDEFLGFCTENIARAKFPQMLQYSYIEKGGHFAAAEEPQLLADDFIKFVNKCESQ